eukprot:superscaffoldBa00006040_g21064
MFCFKEKILEDKGLSCAGFLVMLTPRKLCLLNHQQVVKLGRCDITNPAQQWAWSGGDRLMHTQSSLCLWADPNPRLPAHARLAYLRPCSAAPAWKCDSEKRTFGLAEAQMYLKKQGTRVVIRGNSQYSDWSQYEVDSGGNQLMKSLCPETGERRRQHHSSLSQAGKTSAVFFLSEALKAENISANMPEKVLMFCAI